MPVSAFPPIHALLPCNTNSMPTRPATGKYIPVGVVGHLPGCYESDWRPVNEDKCFRIEDRLLIFNNTVDW